MMASEDDDDFHPEDGTGFRDEEVGGGNYHGDGDIDSESQEDGLVRSDRTDNSRSSKGSSNGRRRRRSRREQQQQQQQLQQPGRQRQRRGRGNGRRGGPRPSSRRNRNGYSTIGGDSSDDDYGYEERSSSSSSSSRGMLCITWFLIISMVVIGIAGLWIYQQDENPFANFDVSGALSNLFGDGSEGSGGSGNGFTNNMDSPHVGDVEDAKKSSSNTSPNYDYNNNNNNQYEKPSSGSSSSTSSSLPSSYSTFDREALNKLLEENHIPTHSSRRPKHKVRYDPTGLLQAVNPFDFTMPNTYGSNVLAPNIQFGDGGSSYYEQDYLGYLQHPDIVNGTLVFSAEGDVFVTTLDDYFATEAEEDSNNIVLSATKLTTTIGNVLDPKLHPSMRYLAYTGTYSGRRDVYLMDLQGPRTPAMRLTYWEVGGAGVSKVIGWVGNSILFRAVSNTVSLRDTRLYLLNLDDHLFGTTNDDDDNDDQGNNNTDNNNPSTVVLGIDPVPFSQANDAVRYQNCWYFVRVKQTSQTIRYVGGTTEDIWKFCDGDETSRRLLSEGYNGTTKSPQVYVNTDDNKEYLLFLSDREKDSTGKNWIPGRMNIWALDKSDPSKTLVKITDTECDFEGRTIQEYTLDGSTGNLIVRIGADLYIQKFDKTRRRLEMAAAAQQEPIRFLKQDNDKKKNDKNKKNQNNNNNNKNQNNNNNNNNNNNKKNQNNNNNNNKNQNNNNSNNGKNTDAPSSAPSASPSAKPSSSPSIMSTNADGELFDGETDHSITTFADGEEGDGEMGGVNATSADGEDGEGDGEMNQTIATSADGEVFDGEIDHNNTTFADGEEGDGEIGGVNATSADGEDGDGDGEMNQTIATSADGEVFDGEIDRSNITFADGEEGDGEMGGVNATSADGEDIGEMSGINATSADDEDGDGEMNQTIAADADWEVSDGEMDGTDTTFATTNSEATNGDDDVVEETAESSMDLNETIDLNQTEAEEGISVYYDFTPPEMESRKYEEYVDHHSGTSSDLTRLPIVVHSDFSAHQERLLEVSMIKHLTSADVYDTTVGGTSFIMTLRGQLWVAPVIDDDPPEYEGSGMNMPHRQYRVAPGATMGGVVRVLKALHVPNPVEDETTDRRLALILATDPLSKTAEHAFYLIETQPGSNPVFLDFDNLPRPFLGGHVSGGATKASGLGSVKPMTLTVSPCGRRMAWSDTDGRILVMNMPQYLHLEFKDATNYTVLPTENELGEPMVGDEVELSFSPGGRYLAVSHNSLNQFAIISIVDLGDPIGDDEVADIVIGRIVQATPSRFNSDSMYWGKSTRDSHVLERETTIAEVLGEEAPDEVATTLYFLSDRDIYSDVGSPWGTRQPMPHFDRLRKAVYALPLTPRNATEESEGQFSGGGASELQVDAVLERSEMLTTLEEALVGRRRLSRALNSALAGVYGIVDVSNEPKRGTNERVLDSDIDNSTVSDSSNDNSTVRSAKFPTDMDIDFGSVDLSFARQAYRLSNIPEGDYHDILCQTNDDGSLVIIAEEGGDTVLKAFFFDPYPSDAVIDKTFEPTIRNLVSYGLSTSRDYFYLGFSPDGAYKVVPNTDLGVTSLVLDTELEEDVVDSDGLFLSVWPSLEHRQMYSDAWRMLRDYFYDPEMTQIDWPAVHERYLPLVSRCTRREELDDVLAQMASELSALHVFVYGGEYNMPVTDLGLKRANNVASLGATLQRAPEWKGYKIVAIPERDPDFNVIDGGITPIYSPLSDQLLRLSGQKGLKVGDVIVGVNGESVMRVPDIHMLLRGMAGRSVRLDVLRLASGVEEDDGLIDESSDSEIVAEPLITVPLDPGEYDNLLYSAWEYKTQMAAETLAAENDFSVGYVHLRDMSGSAGSFDAFARGFFPNYHKDAFILDVRHNRGGSMDSWVLDILQRQAFYYWQGRDFNPFNGGLGWDEQFAFRGHIVVLIDEKTSSDGEGVSRGISELGLGRLVGTRTWGGGIWLSSDNRLVDGGIASAPEIGTYNDKWGWGMGIEQMGVSPDVEVDNEPFSTYKGSDAQLERAIAELKTWLEEEPVIIPKPPPHKKDMTMGERECTAR